MASGTVSQVRAWLGARPRLTSALAIGVGAPFLIGVSLSLTVGAVIVVQSVAPQGAPFISWLWVIVPVLSAAPLWLLVSRSLALGGWRGVLSGIALIGLLSLAFWALGDLEQTLDPLNDMAGLGSGLVAIALTGLAFIVAVMGVVAAGARRVLAPRQPPA